MESQQRAKAEEDKKRAEVFRFLRLNRIDADSDEAHSKNEKRRVRSRNKYRENWRRLRYCADEANEKEVRNALCRNLIVHMIVSDLSGPGSSCPITPSLQSIRRDEHLAVHAITSGCRGRGNQGHGAKRRRRTSGY